MGYLGSVIHRFSIAGTAATVNMNCFLGRTKAVFPLFPPSAMFAAWITSQTAVSFINDTSGVFTKSNICFEPIRANHGTSKLAGNVTACALRHGGCSGEATLFFSKGNGFLPSLWWRGKFWPRFVLQHIIGRWERE